MTLLLSCYEPSTFCLLGKLGHLKIVVLGYIYPSNRPAQLQCLFNLSKGRSSCRETLRPLAVANPLLLHRQLQSTFQVMIELTLLFANLNNSQLPIPLHPPTCVYTSSSNATWSVSCFLIKFCVISPNWRLY